MTALQNIQNELDEQKTMIRVIADTITERVTENINKILDARFKILEEKHDNLK